MIYFDSLLLGVQHSFEPDHMAAISVLASDRSRKKKELPKLIWRSSQWALGHSLSLIILSVVALLLKAVTPIEISAYAEILVGPVMIYLGISAIHRNKGLEEQQNLKKKSGKHSHSGVIHFWRKEERKLKPNQPLNRSFWVGMLHGMAGTGGACGVALILASENANTACVIIMLQSLAILVSITAYTCVLSFSMTKIIERKQIALNGLNLAVGILSIGVGFIWIYNTLFLIH